MPTLVIDRKKNNYSLCKVSRKRAASRSADIAVWSLIGRCLTAAMVAVVAAMVAAAVAAVVAVAMVPG